jgi:hypothetical protein
MGTGSNQGLGTVSTNQDFNTSQVMQDDTQHDIVNENHDQFNYLRNTTIKMNVESL